jgi:PAS domain S-box-containing protein
MLDLRSRRRSERLECARFPEQALSSGGDEGLSPAAETSVLRCAATALVVCCGCYLGAKAGSSVQMPEIGTAVLFPPYAVLTAALLLSSTRTWWVYVLAAAAGGFAANQPSEGVVSFVLLAEVANAARALVAATGVVLLCGRRSPFHTLRDMLAFLLSAAALGPLVGAYVGALDVVIHVAQADFWLTWNAWLLSNTLTGLTLLPMILIAVTSANGWIRRIGWPRVVEAGLLALGLLAVGTGILTGAHPTRSPSSLYGLLPFLLWAAMRFGPGGAISAVSAVTALTIGGAMSGRGPFAAQSPAENLLQLQFFLIAVSTPILLLASLVKQQARTEVALRESKAQYQSVVEDQTELICRLLPDGTYTFVNGAYCRYFGHSPEELLGRKFFMFIPPDGRQACIDFLASITPEHPLGMREHQVIAPGGEIRWQQWTDRGLFDSDGRLLEFQAVGRDITERKRAEEEHRLLEAQRRVEEALREADRHKDEFLAMLAHELRNPLAPVGMALEVMRRRPAADDQTAWAQSVIARQVGQMTRLVDDLLDVSRITRGKVRLELERLDLASLAAQAVETSRPLVDARGHALQVTLPQEALHVRGDCVRLRQIVANLLNNAAKYTEPGGRLELAVAREGNLAVLRVRDNGIGIAPAMLSRVFDLFTQAGSTRDGAQGGLGIGLTLVKRLVELQGGTVEARSAGLGLGSEFTVRLPALAPTSVQRPARPRRAAAEDDVPLRILVVDDNVDAADSLARLMELLGHAVRTAYDGPSALRAAASFEPEAALLDLGLPGMDGVALARCLREQHVDPPLLLVAMTGFGQSQDRRRTAEAGFDLHLVKPIELDALRSALAKHASSICTVRRAAKEC